MTHGKREDGAKSMGEKRLDLVGRLALTVAEAARSVGVSERHLRSMLPEIPHVYLGGRIVIPVESFREWLHQRAEVQKAGVEAVAREILESLGDS